LVTAREPSPAERKVLRETAARMKRVYERDPEGARALLQQGEAPLPDGVAPQDLAAWANVCSVILNTDEAVTKQ
jgi:hypothetical protein